MFFLKTVNKRRGKRVERKKKREDGKGECGMREDQYL